MFGNKCAIFREVIKKNWILCVAASFAFLGIALLIATPYNIFTFFKSSVASSDWSNVYYQDFQVDPSLHGTTIYSKSEKENANSDSQIIVCYYTIPREPNLSLRPSNIDTRICTHIIVGFASVVDNVINLGNTSYIYESVARLKNHDPDLKVMISVGGMDEIQGGFPEMVKTVGNRRKFIRSVLHVTKKLNLNGLDVDWEFPAWNGGHDKQRTLFVQLLRELRKGFDSTGEELLLSIAVAAPFVIADQSYDIPKIAKYVDFVNLMSYDYHFYVWYFPITGHNAPLYPRSNETGYAATLNVNYSTMYWLAKGMPRTKMVIGIPTYGHSYELDNPSNHDLLAPAKGFGKLGDDGFVSYSSICLFLKLGANRNFDRESKASYAYKHNEWVSYEDPVSVRHKAEWIKHNGFKGAMIFSLNEDDWNATCVNSVMSDIFPLTRTIARILRGTGID